jgi:hypothetical protein
MSHVPGRHRRRSLFPGFFATRRRERLPLRLEDLEGRVLPTLLGTQLFPSDYPWNQNISNAPVAANSPAIISHIGSNIGIHPDWGEDSASNGNVALYGIPYNVVHGNSTAKVNVIIDNYPGESDIVPVPIPANAVIEGDYQNGPNPSGGGYNAGQRGDSHLLIWDEDTDTAYELFGVTRPTDPTLFPNTNGVELAHTDGKWHAAQESVWHMTAEDFRALGETSADAAGLSILAGLARPDEGLPVSQGGQGAIDHALRLTLPASDVSSQYIYPASHMVSESSGSTKLPLGSRLRLMDTPTIDAQIAAMGPEAQIIAHAMQQYGLVLADIGSAMYVTGTSASVTASNGIGLTWNMDDVLGLHALTAGDFQVVNLTPVVSGLSQSSAAPGTTITITGQNFSGSAGHLSVLFGSLASPSVTYVDDGHITAVVPAGAGTVDVTVQSGVNETDNISDSPNANVNAPIFGYGTSATNSSDRFSFSATLPAIKLSASATSTVTAGTMFSLTVTALDMNGATAAGFGGTIHFTSTDPLASLPADYTFQPNDFGVHTFQITACTGGSQTITVSDTPDGLTAGQATFAVDPGSASNSKSTVAAAPTSIRAGQTTMVTLTARDAYGNQESAGGLNVAFALSGSAAGSFGSVNDNHNGTYSAMFSATGAGIGTIGATISNHSVTSTPPTLTVAADSAPVIQPIGNITLPGNQFPDQVTVHASSPVNNPLTLSVATIGDNLLYDLEQQYRFTGVGYYTHGATAYLLQSSQPGPGVGGNYLIRPSDGSLFAYDGSGSYAHTFANSANLIATLGVNVYTDPMMLINAQAPIAYPTLYALEQQYQFQAVGMATFGATAYMLKAAANNSFGNPEYLLRPSDGALFPYDGSGSFSHTFANVAPVQINGAPAILGTNVYANPMLLTGAVETPSLYAQFYQLNQQYDLQELNGSFYTNTDGHQAEWLYSPVLNQFGEHWYTLTLQTVNAQQQAVLTAWQGYADSEVGAVIADLDPTVYSHPAWLAGATEVPDPAAGTATIDNSGNLTINLPNSGFVGSFRVVVTASDGLLSTSQAVTVTATDTTPTLTIKQGGNTVAAGSTVNVAHGSFPQSFTVTAGGGDATLTETTSVASYNQLFALEQQYRFQAMGTANYGAMAVVLQAAGNNSFGNADYLLRPSDGALFAYDGSGSYSHTFNNVTPLATLGAVVATDPTLLTQAQAPVDYSILYSLMQQYGFQGSGYANFGAMAYVLKATANNSHGNPYYLIGTNGGLYAYDGSGSYASSFANSANLVVQLDPSLYVNPSVLTGATAAPALYPRLQAVEAAYDLHGVGYAVYGAPAYVLMAPLNNANGNPYYLLGSSGVLYAYDGSGSYAHTFNNSGNLVATLDASVYANPLSLTGATAPLAASVAGAPVTVSQPAGSPASFTVNAPLGFPGTVKLTVTATDGSLTTTQSFYVTSTDTPPVPNTIPPQTASKSGSPLHVTLSSTDAENDSVTYTATPAGYSPEYNLQQQYRFQGMGYATSSDGVKAYVLSVNGQNANGNPYYLLSSSGALYAYDGSGSYGHTFNNGANLIAQLSAADYTTPTLLTNAKAPTAPAALLNVSGNTLTVNVASLTPGTVFQVIVTASDGAEKNQVSFLVTVTA